MTPERFKRSMKFLGIKFDTDMAKLLGVDRRSIYNFKHTGAPDQIEQACKTLEILAYNTRHVKEARKHLFEHLLKHSKIRHDHPALVDADKHLFQTTKNLPEALK